MKFKKLMLVTLMLLAILTIGAVSAADANDTLTADDTNELSQDLDSLAAVDDSQEDDLETPVAETTAGDDAGDVLSYDAGDFNVEINKSMDLRYDDAAAITFDVPDGADGNILVGVNRTDSRYLFSLDDSPITLDDLWIEEPGIYSIYVYFDYTDNNEISHEISLLNGTINVSKIIMVEDFDCDCRDSDELNPIDDLSDDVFDLYDSPADGKLIVFVDNINVYNVTVAAADLENDYIAVTGENLGIDGENSPYHITVIFNTTEDDKFVLADFNAYYEITDSPDAYISIYSMILRDQIVPLVYISDENSVNGTVRVFIDGVRYYNKEFDGSKNSLMIWHDDLDGVDVFDKDFLGNHTVKVTYNNITEESNVTFVFEPYVTIPYDVPAGEVSYIVFNAPGNFIGNVSLYNAVYNETEDRGEIGSLITVYPISYHAGEVPLPELTKGLHLFYVNYTIDGKSDAGFFGVEAIENSQNLSSSISSTAINVGNSLTVTVTGPKEGWIDFYVDMEHIALYSLVNGTVNHTFSDLTIGSHVISLRYDGDGYNDLYYTKSYAVSVSSKTSSIVDLSVDSSDTRIYGELILTDIATGEVFKRNITGDLIKSSLTNPGNYTSEANEIMNQLLSLAQSLAGDKTVTVKTQNVTHSALSRYDNRDYAWVDDSGYSYLEISQDYGTKWIVNVTVIAQYSSKPVCIITFNATGGEGVMENVTVVNNTNYTLPECGFTKENCTFYGWNVGDAIKQPGENITITDNITIKTVWKYGAEPSADGKITIINHSFDSSEMDMIGILILTDARTGEVNVINITVGPVKSNYTAPVAVRSNLTNDTIDQLLAIAQMQAGSNEVIVKNKTVSNFTITRYDTRTYTWLNLYEGADDIIPESTNRRFLIIGGTYGSNQTGSVILEAEYSSNVVNVANVKVVLSKNTFTYNAKVQKPTVTVINGLILKEGVDYTLLWSTDSPKKAGTYTITVTGTGAYTGTTQVTFKINKAANPLKVKAKTVKVKFSKLKKKAQTLKVTKVVKFTKKGQGTLTYKKVKGNKKITINKKNGKVTIKKGLKKGTYKVKVKIKAKGNANYKASAFKTITFKIKVK